MVTLQAQLGHREATEATEAMFGKFFFQQQWWYHVVSIYIYIYIIYIYIIYNIYIYNIEHLIQFSET